MKKQLFVVLIFVPFFNIFGQNSVSYYIKGDSTFQKSTTFRYGEIKYLSKENNLHNFSPYEISEFGLEDGTVYVAKDIEINHSTFRTFLGIYKFKKMNLYIYKNSDSTVYFIEKDNFPLTKLPIQSSPFDNRYKNILSQFTSDCPKAEGILKYITYSLLSFQKLFKSYDKCSSVKYFPHFRYGFFGGLDAEKLIADGLEYTTFGFLSKFSYNYVPAFALGAFIDYPLFYTNFSLHPELYYTQHRHYYKEEINQTDVDFTLCKYALELPVLLRYTLPLEKIKPYANLGFVFGYDLRNSNIMYLADNIYSNTIYTRETLKNSVLTSKFNLNFTVGGGFEINLNSRKSVFFETKYHLPTSVYDNKITTSEFLVITGLIF